MPLTEDNVEAICAAGGERAGALAESFGQCFDRTYRLEPGESETWSSVEGDLGPGLLVLIQVESQGLAILVPESLPLPEWYTQPNSSEKSRLDTLAMEWSLNVLPADLEAQQFRSFAVKSLSEAVARMAPTEWAATTEWLVFDSGRSDDQPAAKLLVVWPLEQPDAVVEESAPPPQTAAPAAPPAVPSGTPPADDRLRRLRFLPVQVNVRLAEKKIPMSQLMSITPGMLIAFNKSCDEQLDLYVNNTRYCRGEAVKIGEKFGLKINQVGIVEEQAQKVIEA